jgi:small subunit ribosomal protein S3
MSVVKRIIEDSIESLEIDELLAEEFKHAGYGGIDLAKTPQGTLITLYTMRPGRVIGKRGRTIKRVTARLESELGIPDPQITVVEVEVPELDPRIMASRIADALERGVHYRRAIFWALRRIMEVGAIGCEILVKGKIRSDKSRFEKVSEGYIPKSGDPAIRQLRSATIHVKLKRGIMGVTVTIVPPESEFPDKVSLEALTDVEVSEDEYELSEVLEHDEVENLVESKIETIDKVDLYLAIRPASHRV